MFVRWAVALTAGLSFVAATTHAAPQSTVALIEPLRVINAIPQTPVPSVLRQTPTQPAVTPPPSIALDAPLPPAGDTFGLKATLYLTTDRDSGKDSIGCRVIPMRTVAVDGVDVRRHTILFIKETVGIPMPDGTPHDGYWYATDVGSAIVHGRIDLYTGKGRATLAPLIHLNLKTLTVTRVGTFTGCPSENGVQQVAAR
jgi:3D (Asp-Asp-Asp) domain-containing protein